MEPQTLRELIIRMEGEIGNGWAINKPATVGQILEVAKMILKELKSLDK